MRVPFAGEKAHQGVFTATKLTMDATRVLNSVIELPSLFKVTDRIVGATDKLAGATGIVVMEGRAE